MPDTTDIDPPKRPAMSRTSWLSALAIGLLIGLFIGECRNRPLREKVRRLEAESRDMQAHWTDDGETLEKKLRGARGQLSEAFRCQGILHAQRKETDKAITAFTRAIQLKPEAESYYNRGSVFQGMKEYDKAIDDFEEAIRLQPDFVQAYNNRGNAYRRKGQLDKALADLGEAIRLDPKAKQAYHNRGLVFAEQKRVKEALADFDEAIRLDPDYAAALRSRGVALAADGRFTEAIEDLTRAVQLEPENRDGHFLLEQIRKLQSAERP